MGTAHESETSTFGPGEAAALLEETRRRAERRFDLRPVWLLPAAAVVVLVCYGVVWLSVRHQHPYVGPAGWALGVLYGTIAVWASANAVVLRRATVGVGGRAARQRTLEGIAFAIVWVCIYVIQGAFDHAGVDKGVVYGIWPAAAPLVVVGSAAAGSSIGQGKKGSSAFAVAAVVLGAGACFAGPAGVWGVIGIGLCALLLAATAAELVRRRA